jgi:hypothetical protein
MTIKEFYLKNYSNDELGQKINDDSTFSGLLDYMNNGGEPYLYIGVFDSLVRERVFQRLAEELNKDYSYVYDKWISLCSN